MLVSRNWQDAVAQLLIEIRVHETGRRWRRPVATVAAEVGYPLARDGGPGAETGFLESLADGTFSPVDLRPEDYRRAGELVSAYRDLGLGTTDATVIALCERLELTEVTTINRRHFTIVRPRHVDALALLPE